MRTVSVACKLIWGMWDLIPWPGIEPSFPALGAWSLSHWTTREIPVCRNFSRARSPSMAHMGTLSSALPSSPSRLPRCYENKQELVAGASNSISVPRERRQIKTLTSISLVKVTPHPCGGLHQLYFLQCCQPVLWILFLWSPWGTYLIGSGFYSAWESFMMSRIKHKELTWWVRVCV